MSDLRDFDFPKQVDLLADCRKPLLIGVRHHSAAMTRALAPLLDAFQPKSILLEMPSDFTDWIEHLADEQTIAPVRFLLRRSTWKYLVLSIGRFFA